MTCPNCSAILTQSSMYFVEGWAKCGSCRGYLDKELEPRVRDAQPFEPIVLHKNVSTGEYSYPGASNDAVPAGYEKVEVRTLRESDRLTKGMSERASAERRDNIRAEREYWDQRTKERRERVDAEMARLGIRSDLADRVRRYVDRKRDRKYQRLMSRPVNVFSQVFSFDSPNRQGHASEHTGWKTRKS